MSTSTDTGIGTEYRGLVAERIEAGTRADAAIAVVDHLDQALRGMDELGADTSTVEAALNQALTLYVHCMAEIGRIDDKAEALARRV